MTLCQYFETWMETYKKPLVVHATYVKYTNTLKQIKGLFGETTLDQITATTYQRALNEYAKTRSKLTVSHFHKQLHACLLDALDERIITQDPARKAIMSHRKKERNKVKCLDYAEWKALIEATYNTDNIRAQLTYLSAVTGLRYAEALGLTWDNVDFKNSKLTVNKTWDYKYHSGFIPTKNKGSVRQIDIDDKTVAMFDRLYAAQQGSADNPYDLVFPYTEGKQLYSASVNRYLTLLCADIGVRNISFHSLRHTHASVLLYSGVSLMAVSRRLGHADTTTTQKVYLHIIREMENREKGLILQALNGAFTGALPHTQKAQ